MVTGMDKKDAVIKALREYWQAFENAERVDLVPVVYCGECKYMMPDGHCTMFADDRIRPSSSDFCSAGERKDGEHHES